MFRQPLRMSDCSQVLSLLSTDYWRINKLVSKMKKQSCTRKLPWQAVSKSAFLKKDITCIFFGLNACCQCLCHLQKLVIHQRRYCSLSVSLLKSSVWVQISDLQLSKTYSKQRSLLTGCKMFLNLSEAFVWSFLIWYYSCLDPEVVSARDML